jgi:acyl-coenzyme A synthetase/AMP-(fatty) acid ligase
LQLAPYKRPSEIRIMSALPASATGKVLRAKLKELAATSASP